MNIIRDVNRRQKSNKNEILDNCFFHDNNDGVFFGDK